jgi:integrase
MNKEKGFERVAPRLYRRTELTATGEPTVLYFARFVCKLKRKRRKFSLGSDLKTAKDELKVLDARNVRREDFDLGKARKVKSTDALTFAEWAKKYPQQEGVKDKGSLDADLGRIRLHLEPVFGKVLLTEFTRELLVRYVDKRMGEKLVRGKTADGTPKAGKVKVKRGTVANELSLLRHMLNIAARENFKVAVPSFDGLIIRTQRGGRALSVDERGKVLEHYPKWLQWLAEFATETCLSEGDILRLTDPMIDERAGIITPDGGRKKTGVEQVSPLTPRAREILQEIKAARKRGEIVANARLIFTREDGRRITRDMISRAVKRAVKATGVKSFVFHNYRNTALTDWARRGINVDVAMKASGHASVQMHKRYVDLQSHDIAAAFGTGAKKMVPSNGTLESDASEQSGTSR